MWTHFVLLLTLRFYFIIDIWYLMYNDGFIHDFLHSVTYLHGVNVKGNNNDRQNVGALFVEICRSSLLLSRGFPFAVTLFCATQLGFFFPDPAVQLMKFYLNTISYNLADCRNYGHQQTAISIVWLSTTISLGILFTLLYMQCIIIFFFYCLSLKKCVCFSSLINFTLGTFTYFAYKA